MDDPMKPARGDASTERTPARADGGRIFAKIALVGAACMGIGTALPWWYTGHVPSMGTSAGELVLAIPLAALAVVGSVVFVRSTRQRRSLLAGGAIVVAGVAACVMFGVFGPGLMGYPPAIERLPVVRGLELAQARPGLILMRVGGIVAAFFGMIAMLRVRSGRAAQRVLAAASVQGGRMEELAAATPSVRSGPPAASPMSDAAVLKWIVIAVVIIAVVAAVITFLFVLSQMSQLVG